MNSSWMNLMTVMLTISGTEASPPDWADDWGTDDFGSPGSTLRVEARSEQRAPMDSARYVLDGLAGG